MYLRTWYFQTFSGWESRNQSGQQTVNWPQPLRQVGGFIIDSYSDSETD